MGTKNFLIVDGHSLIYRAIFRCKKNLFDLGGVSKEEAVGEFFGIFNEVLDRFRPTHLAFCLDSPRKTLRRMEYFPEYKAHREKRRDPNVGPLLRAVVEAVEQVGFTTISVPKWEADDVIASLVTRFSGGRTRLVIVSRDKDLHQVLRENVIFFDHFTNKVVRERDVFGIWGVPPSKIVDVQTLSGDSVDNIPGVPGVAGKRAVDLVKQFGTAKEANRRSAELSPAMARRFEGFDYRMNRKLVRLRRDLAQDVEQQDFSWEGYRPEEIPRQLRSFVCV